MQPEHILGRVLSDDIITPDGTVLVGRGTTITREHLESLARFKIQMENIRVVTKIIDEFPANHSHASLSASQSKLVELTENKIRDFIEFVRKREEIPLDTLEHAVIPYIKQISEEMSFYAILTHLKEHDDYIYRHCLGVSILANYMARWLKYSALDTQVLISAAMLYDIGMTKLPKELIHKSNLYTSDEMRLVQQHTLQGYELLRNTPNLDPRIAKAALQHHERMDGSGYPNRLQKEQIGVEARIIGMLDVYMAMTSNRPYRAAHAVNIVLQMMQLETVELFDPTYSIPFLHNMMSSQIGKRVRLTNGIQGTIMYISQFRPLKPVIKTDDDTVLDLQTIHDVHVQAILG